LEVPLVWLHRLAPALLVLLAGLGLIVPAARGEILSLQSQTRTVGIQIDHHVLHFETCLPPPVDPFCEPDYIVTTSYSDDAVAPDAGPWIATASLAQFPDTFASQDSEIMGSSIHASGEHGAISFYEPWVPFEMPITEIEEPHASDTSFAATFVLATAGFYRLTGNVSVAAGLWVDTAAFIRFTGPGAQVIAETQLEWNEGDCDPAAVPYCWVSGPVPIAASGVLQPGTYTLEAGAGGVAYGYRKFGFGDTVYGDFDLEFTLGPPVPALSNQDLVVLGVSLLSAALWLARRQRLTNI
jgi:hypothetical protein